METDSSKPVPAAIETPAAPAPKVPMWRKFNGMILFTAVLLVFFARQLVDLFFFALHSELYSHILLIPFITGYLIWIKKEKLTLDSRPDRRLAWLPLAAGAVTLAGYWIARRQGWSPARPDYLAVTTLAFLFFWLGGGFICLGANYLRKIAFPVAFMFFCAPFPQAMREGIETFFQHGSSLVAYLFLTATGMPVFLSGTHFQLPSMSLDVAPQCSGIHSSLVLVITSLLASYLFLKTPSRRLILVLAVIPLALLRNGFRVFVIAQLCVRIGPQMIDSPIHRQGGPVFFGLSLIPLFLLLVYLNKSESRKENAALVRPKE
ncbi:MAG TPA: exosortase/archaeosortase family protein [Verrucomicrobiae bacterium]|nr:exosortase/archaeosortase family protein [Verrucomicrobiae bacterium]